MSKNSRGMILLAALLFFLAVLFGSTSRSPGIIAQPDIAVALGTHQGKSSRNAGIPAGADHADHVRERLNQSPSPKQRAFSAPAASHPFPDIPRTRTGLSLDDDPFGAASIEEQAWLDRNGYPNKAQWEAYQSAPDAALEQAALAGEESAASLLDFRRMLAGDEQACASLLDAAALGDDFALELLASYMFRSSERPSRIPVDAHFGMALTRVMEWRGNYSAAISRTAMRRDQFDSVEWFEIDAQAMEILRAFNDAYRAAYGADANPVDPRPVKG